MENIAFYVQPRLDWSDWLCNPGCRCIHVLNKKKLNLKVSEVINDKFTQLLLSPIPWASSQVISPDTDVAQAIQTEIHVCEVRNYYRRLFHSDWF